jgi:hypothetical protein
VALGDRPVMSGSEVLAPTDRDANIRFSDGTSVTLGQRSKGLLSQVTGRGARLRLAEGRAHVRVVPRKDAEWFFDAGPCVVRVTGTKFDMNWSDADQRLDVTMLSGSVVVRGPPAPAGVPLREGQRLVMDVRAGVYRVERVELEPGAGAGVRATTGLMAAARENAAASTPPAAVAGPTAAVAGAGSPSEEPALSRADRAGSATKAASPRRTQNWAAMVAKGDFAGVLGEARRQGVDEAVGRSPAAELMALADAARFTGQPALARRALLAVRTRFRDSGHARRAALLLGRVAEDAEGDLAKSIEWYDIYLQSGSSGALQSEALGRKMTATLKLLGRQNARPLAVEYLRRFPSDSYADPARAILLGK